MRSPAVRLATLDDVAGIARVHVDTWRSTYRGIVPDRYLDSLSYEGRAEQWTRTLKRTDGAFVLVSEEAGTIVGFASASPNTDADLPFAGVLAALYVLASHQGRGHGRVLLCEAARRLSSQGIASMGLWVFAKNPARAFYTKMGGLLHGEKPVELAGEVLTKVAYGWPDLRSLAS